MCCLCYYKILFKVNWSKAYVQQWNSGDDRWQMSSGHVIVIDYRRSLTIVSRDTSTWVSRLAIIDAVPFKCILLELERWRRD